jgi:hypothetical protein
MQVPHVRGVQKEKEKKDTHVLTLELQKESVL